MWCVCNGLALWCLCCPSVVHNYAIQTACKGPSLHLLNPLNPYEGHKVAGAYPHEGGVDPRKVASLLQSFTATHTQWGHFLGNTVKHVFKLWEEDQDGIWIRACSLGGKSANHYSTTQPACDCQMGWASCHISKAIICVSSAGVSLCTYRCHPAESESI